MGGGSTKKLVRSTLALATGPAGEGTLRLLEGKSLIGKDIKNIGKVPDPKVPGVPDVPEQDAGRDELLKRALIDRIRRQAIRSGKSTIHTSPLGVTNRAPVNKKRLTGA